MDGPMGKRNYLIEGVSGTGKSSVCRELRRRGYAAVDGDNELAYPGDPQTGEKMEVRSHEHHIWDVEKVKALVSKKDDEATFFCGGSRNFHRFLDLFDEIFILDVDAETLSERLANRPDDDWGKSPSQRAFILRLHKTKEDIPSSGVTIDTARQLEHVVDEILARTYVSF
jgi:thymidylate kinase